MTYYVALHANLADQHRILDFGCTPETALGYARQIEDGEMTAFEATDRLSEVLAQTDMKPLRFRITDDGKVDVVTFPEYTAGAPATPADAEIERLEALRNEARLAGDAPLVATIQLSIDAGYNAQAEYRARLDASVSPSVA